MARGNTGPTISPSLSSSPSEGSKGGHGLHHGHQDLNSDEEPGTAGTAISGDGSRYSSRSSLTENDDHRSDDVADMPSGENEIGSSSEVDHAEEDESLISSDGEGKTSVGSPSSSHPGSPQSVAMSSVVPTPISRRMGTSKKKKAVHFRSKPRQSRPRTKSQNAIRYLALYFVPVFLTVPISLLLALNLQILTPLYNTYPLTLHTPLIFTTYTIIFTIGYWNWTNSRGARDSISARVCLSLVALSGDLVVAFGRRIGSLTGLLGPEWGSVVARIVLGVGVVGGLGAFTLLCHDHVISVPPSASKRDSVFNLLNVAVRATFFAAHVFLAERFFTSLLSGSTHIIAQYPEKSILVVSLSITIFALLLRSPDGPVPFSQSLHQSISDRFKLSRKSSRNLQSFTSFPSSQLFPLFLLLRVPLVILALRQQLFLRGTPPYLAADESLRVLSSERGVTGQIVVAEHVEKNYRFMRCDASILGGRWVHQVTDRANTTTSELGESIFATFVMQEIGSLAHRSDMSDSLTQTIAMTTDLEINIEEDDILDADRPRERVLVIGLGIGVAASSYKQRGLALDIVELDPVVYHAAVDYFDFPSPDQADTINLIDGAEYISEISKLNQLNVARLESEGGGSGEEGGRMQKWSYVIHDCFTGGGVPGEVFTREFWLELSELVEEDGMVAVNFAHLRGSAASRAIIVTLLSVFEQCRAFNELLNPKTDLTNMVIICSMMHSPLLTFRPPTKEDVQRSRLRSHVYSSFHKHEIPLDALLHPLDLENPQLLLSRNTSFPESWRGGTSFMTWRAMQNLLTREMWMAW